jgi:hypothetical protein
MGHKFYVKLRILYCCCSSPTPLCLSLSVHSMAGKIEPTSGLVTSAGKKGMLVELTVWSLYWQLVSQTPLIFAMFPSLKIPRPYRLLLCTKCRVLYRCYPTSGGVGSATPCWYSTATLCLIPVTSVGCCCVPVNCPCWITVPWRSSFGGHPSSSGRVLLM